MVRAWVREEERLGMTAERGRWDAGGVGCAAASACCEEDAGVCADCTALFVSAAEAAGIGLVTAEDGAAAAADGSCAVGGCCAEAATATAGSAPLCCSWHVCVSQRLGGGGGAFHHSITKPGTDAHIARPMCLVPRRDAWHSEESCNQRLWRAVGWKVRIRCMCGHLLLVPMSSLLSVRVQH